MEVLERSSEAASPAAAAGAADSSAAIDVTLWPGAEACAVLHASVVR